MIRLWLLFSEMIGKHIYNYYSYARTFSASHIREEKTNIYIGIILMFSFNLLLELYSLPDYA